MRQKKIAVMQDLAGIGRCSLTVALPIISAMKVQCCPVITSILSNHTGFSHCYLDDYTDKMPEYIRHWKRLGVEFDGIYSGYLSSKKQLDIVMDFFQYFSKNNPVIIIDPIMGDHGKLYQNFDEEMCQGMKQLVRQASFITPNLTEACKLANVPYKEKWTREELFSLADRLHELGPKKIVITGIKQGRFISNLLSETMDKEQNPDIKKHYDLEKLSKEAYDIDTFDDLKNVANSFHTEKVAIYVNGNNKRGIGHIYRALELADEFYVKPDIYYDKNQTDVRVFGNTTHNLLPIDGIAELYNICKEKKYSLFINDILTTSIDYMIGLRSVLPNAKIVNFEDDGEGVIKADLVINALYHDAEFPQIKAGEKYYICGKTFLFYNPIEIREHVKKVFIAFGGADPQNYTDRLLNIISKQEYEKYQFVVVLGRAKNNVDTLLAYNKYSNIEVLYDVSNMPELMVSCDIAFTSRGRTGYELALLGIPSIAMAQNRREEKHGFVCNENGFTYIGLNPDDEVIEANLRMYLSLNKKSRQHFQNMLLSHDLKNGRRRVMSLIETL